MINQARSLLYNSLMEERMTKGIPIWQREIHLPASLPVTDDPDTKVQIDQCETCGLKPKAETPTAEILVDDSLDPEAFECEESLADEEVADPATTLHDPWGHLNGTPAYCTCLS
jgi:hypothetical protein